MTSPTCPARLLLARHGSAEYVETWFSDEGGWLTGAGREQARALADRLRARRVARVFSSDTSRAVQTAEIVAAALGLGGDSPVVAHKALREVDAGDLRGQPFDVDRLHEVTDRWHGGDLDARFAGGESGAEVVSRYAAELDAIADEHRGETVLVVVHQTAAAIVVPVICGLPAASGRGRQLHNGEYVELEQDAEGWRLVSWSDGSP